MSGSNARVLRRELLTWLLASPLVARAAASPRPAEAPDPDGPIAVLYGRRLVFENDRPHVTVRVLEGSRSFSFVPHGPLVVRPRGARPRRVDAGARLTVRLGRSTPGRSVARVQVGEHLFSDPAGAEADEKFFRAHGEKPMLLSVGTTYGIAGRAVDTRRLLVLLEADGTVDGAKALAARLDGRFGLRPELHLEPVERGHGTLELVTSKGELLATSDDALDLDAGQASLTLFDVPWGMGYPRHGVENRTYRGALYAAVDARGLLAAVNLVDLEQLAKGIVPSEIFASSPLEALKAQAVTARGEILAKVGARHVGDPYLLCAEQHCQVFRGASGEDERSSRAVDLTRGEALFAPHGGPLVPSYYSAVCGGFTENNEAVWGGVPNPSIRGRPDFDVDAATRRFASGIDDALVRDWVTTDVPAFCRPRHGGSKFRWTRSFAQGEVDRVAEPFAVGRVEALSVDGRGVSGRARSLVFHGEKGVARIDGELAIRRAFGMLESGAFVVDAEGEGEGRRFTFRGAGWGHGAGMCQEGAVGRARAGASYRDILAHYFSGAEVVRMYG